MKFIIQCDSNRMLGIDENAVRNIILAENEWNSGAYADSRAHHTYMIASIDDVCSATCDIPKDAIPVGSVEFCESYAKYAGIANNDGIPALNIPLCLRQSTYLLREVAVLGDVDAIKDFVRQNRSAILKPADKAKRFDATLVSGNLDNLASILGDAKTAPFFVSQVIADAEDAAEWRVFYTRTGELIPRPYAICNDWAAPSRAFAREVYSKMKPDIEAGLLPPSGTIDIFVWKDGRNAVVEVHPFIACGLYGFEGSAILSMLRDSWSWLTKYTSKYGGSR